MKNSDNKISQYIKNYLKELQRHFDVTDRKMRSILFGVYQELGPLNEIKVKVKKFAEKFYQKSVFCDKINKNST